MTVRHARFVPFVVPLIVAVLAGALLLVARPAAAAGAPGSVTWSDEFDGPAGSAPDPAKWRVETGGSGWGNGELQYYTDSRRNASLDGSGHLVVTAREESPPGSSCWYGTCRYTSARLLTQGRFSQQYGRFEARIKVPRGQGMWPAFWMLGDDLFTGTPWPASGEIDVMENVGYEPGTIWGSLHGEGRSGANAANGSYSLPGGAAFADDFHVFAVDWEPDAVTWSVDGVEYSRKTPADMLGNPWPLDDPFFMVLNLAVGGYWPGAPDSGTAFPQSMVVDYVRVHAQGDGTGTGVDAGSSPSVPGASPSAPGASGPTAPAESPSGPTGAPAAEPTPEPVASAEPGGTTHAIGGWAGKCLDVPSGDAHDGARPQLWDCTGGENQRWTFAGDGTIRALGKCLDVAWGSRDDGAAVQLASCSGNPAQQFVLTPAGDLVNPQSDKCVDVVDWNSTNGARLQQWSCAGTANQKWWTRA